MTITAEGKERNIRDVIEDSDSDGGSVLFRAYWIQTAKGSIQWSYHSIPKRTFL